MRATTVSGTLFAGWYFVAQALVVGSWWLYLAFGPATLELFVPPGASAVDLLAFRLPDLVVLVPASATAGLAILASARWAVAPCWLAAGAVDYAFAYCVAWALARGGGWVNVGLMAPAAVLSTIAALDASAGIVVVFRRASPASHLHNIAATLGQTAVFWAFFLAVVPFAITWFGRQVGWQPFELGGQRVLSTVLFIPLGALGLASGVTMALHGSGTPLPFAAPSSLVTAGPYAYLRNPMVVAGVGQGMAVGVWAGSWAVILYALSGGVIWQLLVRPAEERDLAASFGSAYFEYCRNVRCWLPRIRPYVPGAG